MDKRIDVYTYISEKTGVERSEVKIKMLHIMYSDYVTQPKSMSLKHQYEWADDIARRFFIRKK